MTHTAHTSVLGGRNGKGSVRVLMIDDHPSQIEGYKAILTYNHSGTAIHVTECFDSESAYLEVEQAQRPFDIIFLDRNLPCFISKKIGSGEDLIAVIRKHMPGSKIVMITSHSEAFVLYNIVKAYAPAGLMVKSDFNANELLDAFEEIRIGKTYYTETVKSSLSQLLSKESYLDHYNRQIITLLGRGVKTKSIPDHLHLSLSAIEKRKAQVRDYLCLDHGSDEDIVREARRLGFI
jgi:DNA-binding NarL/FixJ family response regulator